MGLASRIGVIFTNSLILLPVFASLLTSAIMSAIGAAKLAKLGQTDTIETAHKFASGSTITLWILFAIGILSAFIIIPYLITVPYIFGGAMILFSLLNLAIAGMLFYAANAARTSAEYKDSTSPQYNDAKSAYNNLLVCGILMVLAAAFLIGYSIFTIHKYRKEGGLTGDIALAGKYGGEIATGLGQPELGLPLQAVGGIAEQKLTTEQQAELAKRRVQVGKLQELGGQVQKAVGPEGEGIAGLLKKPELMAAAKGLFRAVPE